jgi:23S rRNA (cytosine1962-C5)-methyltransferase
MISIVLKPGKEHSVLRGHPWIFSGAIASISHPEKNGAIAEVLNHKKQFICFGHYQQSGSISVRVLSLISGEPNAAFYQAKVQNAWVLRQQLGLPNQDTNAFRLIHGEGDGLPGLIVDFYNGNLVMQCHSYGMFLQREVIAKALLEALGSTVKNIYCKSSDTLHDALPTDTTDSYLFGNKNDSSEIAEYGVKFKINWEQGQKTGFFLDQRENRKLLGEMSKGKKVLNTFCYSGGFSLYALKNGATSVTSVDASQKAVDLVVENLHLNGFNPENNPCIKADTLKFLTQLDETFDIIILDPPAFAKTLQKRHKAVMAYKRINELALRKLNPGGILFTFSCSQVVDNLMFKNTIAASAIESGKKVRIIHQLHQPPDHPFAANHPEGEYLKGLVLSIS